MAKGGKQPGAGRPKGSPNKATISANEQKALAREVIRAHISQHIPAIIEAQKDAALGVAYLTIRDPRTGVYVEATSEEQVRAALAEGGEAVKVYTRQPHQPSAAMLLAYAADKPVEPVEHSGEGGGPLIIKWQG